MPNDFADFLSQRKPTPERPLQGQTVLVVEDSRFACEALRLLCQRSGARIRRADTLRSARRHLQAFRPSVVIVDLGLPDGNGADLIRELASATPRITAIIGMSGDDGSAEVALSAGADAFLAKPIATVGQFQAVILSALPTATAMLRPVSDDAVSPDRLAVRDDLARVATVLQDTADAATIAYAAQFLGGLARSADDEELAVASEALAQGRPGALERVRVLIGDRMGSSDVFAA
jgi:DNA-binding response OmpR family regulator